MGVPSLSRDLMVSVSPIDGKKFVPLDILENIINKQTVKVALGITDGIWAKVRLRKPSDLPDRVTKQAKRIFAALVLMEKIPAIQRLLDEGLTDEHLPLSRDPGHEALLSRDHVTEFPFERWTDTSVIDFLENRQWLFLAPILDTNGHLIEVDQECALPFTESSVEGSGAAGVVHRAKIHWAHQRGFEVSAPVNSTFETLKTSGGDGRFSSCRQGVSSQEPFHEGE
jgi:hypothetical protein